MTEEIHEEYQVCYKHPDRKTLLRCNKCNKPICLECAVQTPTGYRCKDCVKAQQKVFDTTEKKDYVIGGLIAIVLGFAGAFVYQLIPFLPSLSENRFPQIVQVQYSLVPSFTHVPVSSAVWTRVCLSLTGV